MENTTTMADDHYLPIEILTSILKRLPPKALMKFLSVSKSFYSIITNPNFISSHHHHHLRRSNHHLHLRRSNHHLFFLESNSRHSLSLHNHSFADRTPLTAPNNPTGTPFHSVAGSCNGLVCLFNHSNRLLCIWNPTIRKHLIPDPIPLTDPDPYFFLGFGFDSFTNDYKVVAIARSMSCFVRAQFYSVKSGVWKSVEFRPSYSTGNVVYLSEACFVDGVLYWMMLVNYEEYSYDEGGDADRGVVILTFDLREEVLGVVRVPPCLEDAGDADLDLAVIGNSLAMLNHAAEEGNYDVWLMQEGGESWRVLYRIKVVDPVSRRLKLCDSWEGKGVIVTSSGSVLAFDEQSSASSSLVDGEIVDFSGEAFGYIESLALLDKFSDPSRIRRWGITS